MRVLLLLAAAVIASPALAATPAPQPAAASPSSAKDVRKDAPQTVLPTRLNDDRRIQVRPGKPHPEGKAGPGIG